ncbi:hypothetical protein SODALDRAFT_107807 [Sodiomyces alkalinus F11]|uniref:Uncharacterized protein n=1 Tax=Sodiomyces alkalinus (strain CBS 110278 / VKM F-3762 / F11) TaxID=1314773 RepID=A0A3N2Q2C7_SODAK|nr:hypothetical protein SODALDRAFT_107807 [Sodiomyces alkalinus F11]ROT40914.1 hypothetical protein SODALDRAFT_107807 [Sodiomyces alkalinus F11]
MRCMYSVRNTHVVGNQLCAECYPSTIPKVVGHCHSQVPQTHVTEFCQYEVGCVDKRRTCSPSNVLRTTCMDWMHVTHMMGRHPGARAQHRYHTPRGNGTKEDILSQSAETRVVEFLSMARGTRDHWDAGIGGQILQLTVMVRTMVEAMQLQKYGQKQPPRSKSLGSNIAFARPRVPEPWDSRGDVILNRTERKQRKSGGKRGGRGEKEKKKRKKKKKRCWRVIGRAFRYSYTPWVGANDRSCTRTVEKYGMPLACL